MGKKFNELAELRDRSRQLMDENRRLRLALKVSEGRAQQLAWKNAELRNQAEKKGARGSCSRISRGSIRRLSKR